MASSFRRLAHRASASISRDLDRIGREMARGEGHGAKVRLLAYAGYRNADRVRLKARVVRYAAPLDAGEGLFSRMRAMWDIYNSHELRGVTVRVEGFGLADEAVTDDEGYVSFDLPCPHPLPARTEWQEVTLSTPHHQMQQPSAKVPIIAPGLDNKLGIISDIDDTVIETGATNFVKNWRRVLVEQPRDRLAVPGASTLYRMMAEDHVAPARPFFYVSSSPWNLYGFLTEFMELNAIPHGPMFLKDYGIDDDKFIKAGHGEHKLAAIATILDFYPGTRFLLIGDNGQKDVDIYAEAVRTFPDRVAGVFIRDVSGTCREGAKADLLRQIEAQGVPTFCGAGFEDAMTTAQALGLDRPIEAAKAVAEPA